ncbi:MAG: hypothetical protein WC887_00350 [Candidatus Paceibacterota bacterium]|jgi:hypothetical protein
MKTRIKSFSGEGRFFEETVNEWLAEVGEIEIIHVVQSSIPYENVRATTILTFVYQKEE